MVVIWVNQNYNYGSHKGRSVLNSNIKEMPSTRHVVIGTVFALFKWSVNLCC